MKIVAGGRRQPSEYELGFVRGVLAGRNITVPTDEDLRAAFDLLKAHLDNAEPLIN